VITARCYVHGCERSQRITLMQWIRAVFATWPPDTAFFACEPHYDLSVALDQLCREAGDYDDERAGSR